MSEGTNRAQVRLRAEVRRRLGLFPSCASDGSGEVREDEVSVVIRILRGQKLCGERHVTEDVKLEPRESVRYWIGWYWEVEPLNREVAEMLQARVVAACECGDAAARALAIRERDRHCGNAMRRWYPRQWYGPVMRLMGREVLRPVRCAGATWMELTSRGRAEFSDFLSDRRARLQRELAKRLKKKRKEGVA